MFVSVPNFNMHLNRLTDQYSLSTSVEINTSARRSGGTASCRAALFLGSCRHTNRRERRTWHRKTSSSPKYLVPGLRSDSQSCDMKRGFSRTGQVFKRWRGDGGSYLSAEEVEKRLAEAPGYVPRLAWRPQPRQITDWPLITEALASDRNMAFFATTVSSVTRRRKKCGRCCLVRRDDSSLLPGSWLNCGPGSQEPWSSTRNRHPRWKSRRH